MRQGRIAQLEERSPEKREDFPCSIQGAATIEVVMSYPYRRWKSKHGHKRVHSNRIGGYIHIIQVWIRYHGPRWQRMSVYACRWSDSYREGEVAKRHYHVGRSHKWQ